MIKFLPGKSRIQGDTPGLGSKSRLRGMAILPVALILMLVSLTASASHFRYGNISWTRVSQTATTVTIKLNVSLSWALNAAPTSASFAITGGITGGSVTVPLTNTTDPSGGWTNSVGSAQTTLTKTSSIYSIAFNSGNKISGLSNNNGGYWNVFTLVNTNAPGSSPVSTLPAIVNMPVNVSAATYTIPASDPDANSILKYRLATPVEMAGQFVNNSVVTQPTGLSIDSLTGKLTFNTIGKAVNQLWNAGVVVTDNDGNRIFLDFLIKITASSTPPVFDYAVTPANGAIYNVIAGQNLSFVLKATDSDPGSTVSLSASGLPAYITTSNFSPTFPATGNPSQTTFNYTPAAAQIGSTIVLNFIATDNVGVQNSTSVTVRVVAEPAPVFTASTPGQNSLTQIQTGVAYITNITAQSPLGSNVKIAFANGVPAGAVLSPNVPTLGANPGTTQLTWVPTPADFGQKNLNFIAQISNVPTIFSTRDFSLIVNTPPAFGSVQADAEVTFGTPFTYNITVADADIPFGDNVNVVATNLPSWLTFARTGNGTATLSGTPTLADGGVYHIVLEAEDIYHHGNPEEVVQEFDITVPVDQTVPVVKIRDIKVSLGANGVVSITPEQIDNGSSDNSGSVSLSLDRTNFSCGDLSARNVATIVSDASWKQSTQNISTPEPYVSVRSQLPGSSTYTLGANVQNPYGQQGFFQPAIPGASPIRSFSGLKFFKNEFLLTGRPQSLRLRARVDNVMEIFINGVSVGIEKDFDVKNFNNSVYHDLFIDGSGVQNGYNNGMQFDFVTSQSILDLLHEGSNEIIFAIGNSNTSNDDGGFMVRMDAVANGVPVVLTALDPSGNSSTATAFVVVEDKLAPAKPILADLAGECSVTAAIPTTTDNCSGVVSGTTTDPLTYPTQGSRLINWTFTDASGNVTTATQKVTVLDVTPPVITSAQPNVIVALNASGTAALANYTSSATATDNCTAAASIVFTQSPVAGTPLVPNVPTTVTLTATDAVGKFSIQTFTVTAKDQTSPTAIAKNITRQLDASGKVTITAADVNDGSSDNVGIASMTVSPATFDCSNINVNSTGSLTYNMGADDYIYASISKDDNQDGNLFASGADWSATYSGSTPLVPGTSYYLHVKAVNGGGAGMFIGDFRLTGDFEFEDGSKTLVTNPNTFKLSTSGFGANYQTPLLLWPNGGAIWGYKSAISPGAQFIYGPTNTWYFSAKIKYVGSSNTVTLTVADASGNVSTATANVTIEDKTAPVKPELATVTGECSATASVPTTTDNCKGIVTGTTTDPLTYNAQGSYVIHWKFDDGNGNITLADQNVIVKDVTAPTIAQPADINVIATSAAGAVVNYTAPVGTDNCSATTLMTTGLESGKTFPIGTTKVTYTVTDIAGLAASTSFDVTVTGIAPSIVVPDNISVNNASGECGAKVSFEATEITAIPASVITYSIQPGSDFRVGTTEVTAIATNAVGTSTGTFTVTVIDNEVPVIANNGDKLLNTDSGVCGAKVEVKAIATDNCSVGNPVGKRSDGLALDAVYPVGNTIITWNATDIHENIAVESTQVVTVEDHEAPQALAQNVTVQLDATGHGSTTAEAVNNGSNDACGIRSIELSKTNFDCSIVGANTVTLTVTDIHGNVSTTTAVVNVEDKVAPAAIVQNVTVQLNASGLGTTTAEALNNGSNDACGIRSIELSKTNFDCSNVGANEVTLTVTDIHGNVSTATATVTVEDKVAPIVLTKNITIQLDKNGVASIDDYSVNNGSLDNCQIKSVVVSKKSFDCSNVGANTVTLTVTDIHGNVSTASAIVTVKDEVAPVAIAQNVTISLVNGSASITPEQVNNGSSDACGIRSLSLIGQTTYDCSNFGTHPVTLVVTDKNGNVSKAPASITVYGETISSSIASQPTNNTYTGGNVNNLYLGYGAQSTVLKVTPVIVRTNASVHSYTYSWSGNGVSMLSSTTEAAPVFAPTAAGSYTFTVQVTSFYGCATTSSITICVKDIREVDKKGKYTGKIFICHVPGGDLSKSNTLSISTNAVEAHLTQHSGDRLGTCDQQCGTAAGTTFADVNETVSSDKLSVVSDNELKANANALTVYPNPFAQRTTVSFTLINSEDKVSLDLFGLNGAKVQNVYSGSATAFKTKSFEFNSSNLPSGTYFFRLTGSKVNLTFKVIIAN